MIFQWSWLNKFKSFPEALLLPLNLHCSHSGRSSVAAPATNMLPADPRTLQILQKETNNHPSIKMLPLTFIVSYLTSESCFIWLSRFSRLSGRGKHSQSLSSFTGERLSMALLPPDSLQSRPAEKPSTSVPRKREGFTTHHRALKELNTAILQRATITCRLNQLIF